MLKVSVVIITYNQEHCIDRVLGSVFAQKGDFELEVIVGNDASTDGTFQRLEWWKNRYPKNLKIINHEENVGFRKNYLSAVRVATGKYMCMCDADDYWTDRSKVRRQVEYMERNPGCAICFHRVINVYEHSGEKTLSNGGQQVDTTIVDLSRRNYITNLSVMYRRECVPASSLPEWLGEVSLPDYAYHMLYANHGYVHYMKRPMGTYIKSESGAWSLSSRVRQLEMSLDVRLRLMDYFGEGSEAYVGLRDASVDILVAIIAYGDEVDSAQYVRKIMELNPALDKETIAGRVREVKNSLMRSRVKRSLAKNVYRCLTRALPNPKAAK